MSTTVAHRTPSEDDISMDIQHKTFVNWINEQLKLVNCPPVSDLRKDLASGVKLIVLVECLQKRKLKRSQNPIAKLQAAENVQIALNAIASDNIQLNNIGLYLIYLLLLSHLSLSNFDRIW